jgi:hypothetical protein
MSNIPDWKASGNIGAAYHSFGQYEKAIDNDTQALEIIKETNSPGPKKYERKSPN